MRFRKDKLNENSIRRIHLIRGVVGVLILLSLIVACAFVLVVNAEETSTPITSTIVPDGVYAFKNKASGYYMDIRGFSRNTGAEIQQYTFDGVIPHTEDKRSGLYRVERIGTTEYYVIRTMMDSNNCIAPDSSGKIFTYALTGSTIPNSCKWKIIYSNGYYTLSPYSSSGTNMFASVQDTTSSGTPGGDLSLLKCVLSSSDDKAKWQLYPYTGSTFRSCDLEIRGSHIINPGSSLNISNSIQWSFFYSTVVGEVSPGTITGYSLVNPSGSSAAVSIATISNGTVSGVSGKTGMVAVKPSFSTGCTSKHYPLLHIAPGSGEYFYMQYSDIDETDLHYVTNVGYTVKRSKFNSDPSQIWEVVRVSNNTADPVLIRNVGTGYYLTSSSSTAENAVVRVNTLLQGSPYDKKQLWYISNTMKTFKLQSVYQKEKNMHMGVTFQSGENSSLIQTTVPSFINFVSIGNDVVWLGIWEGDRDRCTQFHRSTEYLLNSYDSFSYQLYVTTSPIDTFNLMKNSKIFISRSHGSPNSILLNQKQNVALTKNLLNSYAQSSSLNNVDIVAFMGCNTANGVDTITHAAHSAGAKVAIGTTLIVSVPSANAWIEAFFVHLAVGFDVDSAIMETNLYIGQVYDPTIYPNVCNCIYVGDGTFMLP